MGHQGNILKKLIKSSNMQMGDFADKMEVSRQYLYLLYGKEILDEDFIKKACEVLNVNKNVFTGSNADITIKDQNMDQPREIQLLEREIQAHKATIEALKASVRRLEGSEALEQAKATIKAKDDQIQLLKKEIEERAAWKGMTIKESVSSEKHKHSEK